MRARVSRKQLPVETTVGLNAFAPPSRAAQSQLKVRLASKVHGWSKKRCDQEFLSKRSS
jgi:hypothetical protein